MRDAYILILDAAGIFGSWGLISFFSSRASFWAFRALRIIFWSFLLGFLFFTIGDFMRASGFDLEIIDMLYGETMRPVIYRSIIVAGLCAGNLLLRQRVSNG